MAVRQSRSVGLTVPYVNPVIGYWDGLGYTRCVDCVAPYLADPELTSFDSGNGAASGCVCDSCGADIGALFDPGRLVHVSWDAL